MEIRGFQPEDFEALYRLDQACYEPGIAYARVELAAWLLSPGARAWVAEDEGGLVAFILVRKVGRNRGHVITLDVREDYRRRGLGRGLHEVAEAWLGENGVRRVRLETAVDNAPAVAFWRAVGYEIKGVSRGYYLGRYDAYRMEKELR